jgi:hypothetical protein
MKSRKSSYKNEGRALLYISVALLSVGWVLIIASFTISPFLGGLSGQHRFEEEMPELNTVLCIVGLLYMLPISFILAVIHRLKYGKGATYLLSNMVFSAASPGLAICVCPLFAFIFDSGIIIAIGITLLAVNGLVIWATRWNEMKNQQLLPLIICICVMIYVIAVYYATLLTNVVI